MEHGPRAVVEADRAPVPVQPHHDELLSGVMAEPVGLAGGTGSGRPGGSNGPADANDGRGDPFSDGIGMVQPRLATSHAQADRDRRRHKSGPCNPARAALELVKRVGIERRNPNQDPTRRPQP